MEEGCGTDGEGRPGWTSSSLWSNGRLPGGGRPFFCPRSPTGLGRVPASVAPIPGNVGASPRLPADASPKGEPHRGEGARRSRAAFKFEGTTAPLLSGQSGIHCAHPGNVGPSPRPPADASPKGEPHRGEGARRSRAAEGDLRNPPKKWRERMGIEPTRDLCRAPQRI